MSYFEWVQNLQQFHWEHERVNQELERRVVDAWRRVFDRSISDRTPMRIAAYVEALSKVAVATRQRL